MFDAPIPGMSLTHELGARPWQSPAQYTTVDEAVEYYLERMSTDEFMNQMADVLEMNVPVTTLANTIQLAGVMDGKHSVDVGMLVMPLLMEMIMLIGDNAGVNYDSGLTDAPNNTTKDTLIEAVRKEMQEKINEAEEESKEPEQEEIEEEPKSGLMARR
jgi:hypothetical protein|tara:strand:- start:121 stop:597 length:477 start_codon:yes stop_codon:yes gene_type:complete